jgi:flagellar biogenesis protein FliO
MLFGRFILLAFLGIICCGFIGTAAFAQTAGDEAESPRSQTPALDQPELVSVGEAIPPEVTTRESFESPASEGTVIGPTAADYTRVFVGLIFVIIVIWGLSVLLKRLVTVRGLASTTESLKVLYSLSLTPTRTLYLVRLGDRILLIGASEGGLRTLAELSEPEEVSAILQELEFKGNFDLNPFRQRLQSLVSSEPMERDEDLDSRQRRLKASLDRLRNAGNDRSA